MKITEEFYNTSKIEKVLQVKINNSYNNILELIKYIKDENLKKKIINAILLYEEAYNEYYATHTDILICKAMSYIKQSHIKNTRNIAKF